LLKGDSFSAFSSAQNENEIERWAENEEFKRQFSQVEGDFNLQEMPKLVLFLRKSTKEEDNCDILCLRSSIVRDKNLKNQKYKKLKKP
jgi:hypothetical protein